ncbi:hypothetical protein EST38_g5689 [Candolleomyces aberdarensis]|uniref:Uncharacterized protein n=1 Tax=Candolleomyces aberdarensis TaxID=2316362 RepID=A0A4V1Q3Y0_9AGAR|nr:hypothetical protein EST38_g5689 [Candolleomyces aberdarensis]
MLTSGKGLASWSPRPRDPLGERGVVPGDVGTFSAQHGFKKIFNLQEDKGAIRSSKIFGKNYSLPKMHVVTHKEELSVGETIVKGTSVKTQYTQDGRLASFEFKMLEPEGAVLALTSSADLEEFRSHVELRDFIIDNAASLYRYANSIQRLDYHESLYIVTGCIKSDSWALAAYNDLPDPQNDVLKLIRTEASGSASPAYVWTDRGTAEARSGSTQNGGTHKDQCLFLQGFKVAFSAAFRSRMKANLSNLDNSCDGEGASDSDTSDESNRRQGDSGGNRKSNDAGAGGIGSKGCSQGGPSDELLVEYFPKHRTEDELLPCDKEVARWSD